MNKDLVKALRSTQSRLILELMGDPSSGVTLEAEGSAESGEVVNHSSTEPKPNMALARE